MDTPVIPDFIEVYKCIGIDLRIIILLNCKQTVVRPFGQFRECSGIEFLCIFCRRVVHTCSARDCEPVQNLIGKCGGEHISFLLAFT